MIDEKKARRVIRFIECLKHTKGEFHGKPFKLLPWQEKIIRDVFGTVRDEDPSMRQYNQVYIEIGKKNGKSELGAALALNMLINDDEWKAEVYSCASDRQQAAIVFDVAVDMVRQNPTLSKLIKIIPSTKRMVYQPTGSIYQVLSSEVSSQRRPSTSPRLMPVSISSASRRRSSAGRTERWPRISLKSIGGRASRSVTLSEGITSLRLEVGSFSINRCFFSFVSFFKLVNLFKR